MAGGDVVGELVDNGVVVSCLWSSEQPADGGGGALAELAPGFDSVSAEPGLTESSDAATGSSDSDPIIRRLAAA